MSSYYANRRTKTWESSIDHPNPESFEGTSQWQSHGIKLCSLLSSVSLTPLVHLQREIPGKPEACDFPLQSLFLGNLISNDTDAREDNGSGIPARQWEDGCSNEWEDCRAGAVWYMLV